MADSGGRYQAYLKAVRDCVCPVCLDRRDDGSCGLRSRTCAIEAHLPGIVATIQEVRSQKMDDYVDAIQDRICRNCPCQDQSGACRYRQRGECAAWTYLPLLVEALDEVAERESPDADVA